VTGIQQEVPEEPLPADGADRYRAYGPRHLDMLARRAGLSAADRLAIRAVATVLPFRVNSYVVEELIDWTAAARRLAGRQHGRRGPARPGPR